MSTITAILEADADGTLRLQVPPEFRGARIKVEAKLEVLEPDEKNRARPGLWKTLPGRFWMADDFDAPLDDFGEYME